MTVGARRPADSARAATEELAVPWPGFPSPATVFLPIAPPPRAQSEPGPTSRSTRAYLEANPGLPRGQPRPGRGATRAYLEANPGRMRGTTEEGIGQGAVGGRPCEPLATHRERKEQHKANEAEEIKQKANTTPRVVEFLGKGGPGRRRRKHGIGRRSFGLGGWNGYRRSSGRRQ